MRFVDVILPFPLEDTYTYCLPAGKEVQVGGRVLVQFGSKRVYAAIVCALHDVPPRADLAYKDVLDVLDNAPVVLPEQLRLWQWMAKYYCTPLGEVLKLAMPPGFRLESKTILRMNDDVPEAEYSPVETTILSYFADGKEHELSSLQKDLDVRGVFASVRRLVEREVLQVSEAVKATYRPLTASYVRLLSTLPQKLSPKQRSLVQYFADNGHNELPKEKIKQELGLSDAVIATAAKNGIVEIVKKEKSRLSEQMFSELRSFMLSPAQQVALNDIKSQMLTQNTVLLHGITSSGKTEIYIRLIQEVLTNGGQTLFLVPEIALTTQLTARLRDVFGNDLGVYHSALSDGERVEVWKKMLGDNPYKILLGTRSSVFLPFRRLALTVIDEEHDTSYKQQDMAPRYHARTVAVMLGVLTGAKTLLGTATPSVESENNARNGKFGKVKLEERYGNAVLPEIILADVKQYKHRKQMKSQLFTPVLVEKMQQALERQEQVILFQNHRGYASVLECADCGYVPRCSCCDVTLTSHQHSHVLVCHYCGRTYPMPKVCPQCGKTHFEEKGFGTERVEEEVFAQFPQARVARLDLDTTRKKHSFEKILSDFSEGKVDVLVGTQMVCKGLDFGNVSVVGVLSADSLLNFPDFRAHEQAFQMLTQVSGRAGRRERRGTVVIQTMQASHPLLAQVKNADYETMYQNQMLERKAFCYPPFCRLMSLSLRHKDKSVLSRASAVLRGLLLKSFPVSCVLGPETPPISRVSLMYVERLLLKLEMNRPNEKMKDAVREAVDELRKRREFQQVSVSFDVDPM